MKDFIKDVSMRLIIEGGPRVSDGDAACPAQSGQQIKQTCKRWLKILEIYTMGGWSSGPLCYLLSKPNVHQSAVKILQRFVPISGGVIQVKCLKNV